MRFSGILGQSQPPELTPLAVVGVRGVAFDSVGRLWTYAEDGKLTSLVRRDNVWTIDRTVRLPAHLGVGTLQQVGERLWLAGGDGRLYRFEPASGRVATFTKLPKSTVAFYVDAVHSPNRLLALAGTAVMAAELRSDAPWHPLFELKTLRSGRYNSLAVDPADGTILVGSSWPDCTVRSYDDAGRETRNPRIGVRAEQLITAAGEAWALNDGATALNLTAGTKSSFRHSWYSASTGLARADDGAWWMATSQGLLTFASDRQPAGRRIGGLTGPALLAVAADGTLLAYERGRMLKMTIDDLPDSPLSCHWLEAFRVGANWKSHGCAMQFDGIGFLVLDDRAERIWTYDPWHTGWQDKTWQALTPEHAFNHPKSLAVGNGRIFVADTIGVTMRRHPGTDNFVPTGIKATGLLAANRGGMLFLATGDAITAYDVSDSGSVIKRWNKKIDGGPAIGIAAGERVLAVVNGAGLALFGVDQGVPVAIMSSRDVPGGMAPTAVAVLEPWILVGDAKGRRILRFRCD